MLKPLLPLTANLNVGQLGRDMEQRAPRNIRHFGEGQQPLNPERAIHDVVGNHGTAEIPTNASANPDIRTETASRRMQQLPDSTINSTTPLFPQLHPITEISNSATAVTIPTTTAQQNKRKWKCSTSHHDWNELPWKNYIREFDLFFPMRKQGCEFGEEVVFLLERNYRFPREDFK